MGGSWYSGPDYDPRYKIVQSKIQEFQLLNLTKYYVHKHRNKNSIREIEALTKMPFLRNFNKIPNLSETK